MRIRYLALTFGTLLPCWSRPAVGQQLVAFVGCPADGQVGPIAAPTGAPRRVAVPERVARDIAYYEGYEAPGVFAPRGWRCRVAYGSSGSLIVVSPSPVDLLHYPPQRTRGPAVESSVSLAGTSGRFDAAVTAARLFPRIAANFIESVRKEGLEPDSEFSPRPYAHDSLAYLDSTAVEFMTPAGADGLGTEEVLEPSGEPIRGFVRLVLPDSESDGYLSVLRVRLGPRVQRLEAAILQLNEGCLRGGPC